MEEERERNKGGREDEVEKTKQRDEGLYTPLMFFFFPFGVLHKFCFCFDLLLSFWRSLHTPVFELDLHKFLFDGNLL